MFELEDKGLFFPYDGLGNFLAQKDDELLRAHEVLSLMQNKINFCEKYYFENIKNLKEQKIKLKSLIAEENEGYRNLINEEIKSHQAAINLMISEFNQKHCYLKRKIKSQINLMDFGSIYSSNFDHLDACIDLINFSISEYQKHINTDSPSLLNSLERTYKDLKSLRNNINKSSKYFDEEIKRIQNKIIRTQEKANLININPARHRSDPDHSNKLSPYNAQFKSVLNEAMVTNKRLMKLHQKLTNRK